MGVINRIAGTGSPGGGGHGGRATEVALSRPDGVAVTAGLAGAQGDGVPAREATLNTPAGVAETVDGGFLIAERGNHTVRKVATDGVITLVAGTPGVAGGEGDGGPATSARLSHP